MISVVTHQFILHGILIPEASPAIVDLTKTAPTVIDLLPADFRVNWVSARLEAHVVERAQIHRRVYAVLHIFPLIRLVDFFLR